jgi:hypothetical protein
MIIVRISGGLGNQMFQYAMARSFSKNKNNIFKLDLSFYLKQTLRNYELNLFHIEENIASDEESILLRGKKGLYYKVRKKLKFPLKYPDTVVKEKFDSNIESNLSYSQEDIYLDGVWQNQIYFADIRDKLIDDFTPKNMLSKEAKNYMKDIKKKNSISLHVRRGDYIVNNHTNSFHGICDIKYYKTSIEYICRNVQNPIFYIFSDDIKWCEENFSFLKDKIYVKKTKSAIEDLELMKNCHHNIIANSSFSWWGAWLNDFEKKIVITPKIWWNAMPERHIAPKEWIKI